MIFSFSENSLENIKKTQISIKFKHFKIEIIILFMQPQIMRLGSKMSDQKIQL